MAERGAPIGNTNATKDKRLITDALRRAAAQNADKLKEACEKIIENAANGDLASFNVLADRLDGKPAQALNIGGQEDNPLLVAPANERPKVDKEKWLEAHGIEQIEKAG